MSVRTSLSPLLLGAALLGACTKEEAPPKEDRTLAGLRAEAERVEKGGAPSGPPARPATPEEPAPSLADLATTDSEGAGKKLRLPESNATQHVDTLAVKLTELESSHSVKGSKLSLTTEELFLRVQLVAQNVGAAPAAVGLEGARLVDGQGKEYRLARDAQIAAGTRQLSHSWAPEERADVVLFFEIPPPALESSLTLVLPASSGEVRLALR